MRARIQPEHQGGYWNAIAADYQRMTRIRCDDFHYGPQIPGESTLRLLPGFAPGTRALELGCGGAQNSIWLARRGMLCTAMDASEAQLGHARRLIRREGVAIRLLRGELESFRSLLDGACFDFIHSSHALEFVDDPSTVIHDMVACLNPGGTLMVSTVHPLFNGEWIEGEGGVGDAEPDEALVGEGLFLKSYFAPPDDIRDDSGGHAISRAHPVSAWFRWLRNAGLDVEALEEPPAIVDAPYTSDDWADHGGQLDAIPSTVIFVARLAASRT